MRPDPSPDATSTRQWQVPAADDDLSPEVAKMRDKLYGYMYFHLSQAEFEGVDRADPRFEELLKHLTAFFAQAMVTHRVEPGAKRYPVVQAYLQHILDIVEQVTGASLEELGIDIPPDFLLQQLGLDDDPPPRRPARKRAKPK